MPDKPLYEKPEDWLTTVAGQHPALRNIKDGIAVLTEEEKAIVEARAIIAREEMDSRRPDVFGEESEHFARCQRQIDVAWATIKSFADTGQWEKITEQRRYLATAFYQLGRFDDALTTVTDADGVPEVALVDLYDRICEIIVADSIDDTLTHGCERPDIIVDTKVEPVYSAKNKCMAWLYRCSECGRLNLTPEENPQQQHIEMLQRRAYEDAHAQSMRLIESERKRLGSIMPVNRDFSDERVLGTPPERQLPGHQEI